MLGAWRPDTTVQGAAGPATLPACSAARGQTLSVCVRSSLGQRFPALRGRDTGEVSLILRKAVEQGEQRPAQLCPVRAGHWAGRAGSASLPETNPLPSLLRPSPRGQPLPPPRRGPRTPIKESWCLAGRRE